MDWGLDPIEIRPDGDGYLIIFLRYPVTIHLTADELDAVHRKIKTINLRKETND